MNNYFYNEANLSLNNNGMTNLMITMAKDCKNINDNYDFFDLIIKHTGSYVSRDKFLYWFDRLWEYIPQEYLYEVYKYLLSDIHILKGSEYYTMFFEPKLLSIITKYNIHDTVENPELASLLDENGYLTIYLGHCKRTLHNCHSWTLNKDHAIDMGYIRALLFKKADFYCVTGKVRLSDIITSVDVRGGRHDVAVLQCNVRDKAKEFFNLESDFDFSKSWKTWWI